MADLKPPIIFLMGPTASGKSALAMSLAEVLPVEIISVDSTQVYRSFDIGSAKPSSEEQAQVRHHLLDIRDPANPYSVAEFRIDALDAIKDILARDKIPLLVGGTMLYFKTLLDGMAELPEANAEVRALIEQEAAAKGWPAMHAQLAKVDPSAAARLHPNHSQRIARALEVYRVSGRTLTELHQQQVEADNDGIASLYSIQQLALDTLPREVLHQRIASRFQTMLDLGFEAEVYALKQRGDLDESLPAIRAVGYRQMWAYLHGRCDFDEMQQQALAATRQLAKRQLTWLRSWLNLNHLTTMNEHGELPILQIREQALKCIDIKTI